MSAFDAGRVHFIGIGGAGMSAIAKVLIERGIEVSGSDLKRSRAAAVLAAMGATVHVGHDADLVAGASVVVASTAIRETNPELSAAHSQGIPVLSRGAALAAILDDRRSIVVAGTHGKTTTTSMIVTILLAAGEDPTFLIGGGLNESGTNARSGSSDVAVAESDESDGSFLLLHPHIAVVTNVEEDHVDYWRSLADLRAAFERFLSQVDPAGAAILPVADDALVKAAADRGLEVITFGAGGDVSAEDVTPTASGVAFSLRAGDRSSPVELQVPGEHNVSNALAAAAACIGVGLDTDAIARGVGTYSGVERRFHRKGAARGVTVIDDYAHHPTEVKATLAAARDGGWERVVAVFQPHRYSRTAAFATGFGEALGQADRVVVTDVYGAGEEPVPGVTGKLVADAVCSGFPGRPVAYLPHRAELVSYLESSLRPGDVILTLGAGDVTSLGDELLVRLGDAR